MANLINLLAQVEWNTGFWGKLIGWFHSGIGNYVWTIIIFTIVLKLVMSPLDYFQRRVAKKNAHMQKIMEPELEKVRAKYFKNPEKMQQKVNEKQMELYKKHNYNVVGSCFIMLINLVLTMVVFFTLFSSLNTIANIQIANQFDALRTEYEIVVEVNGDKTAAEKAKADAITEATTRLDELYNSLIESGFSSEDAQSQRDSAEAKIGQEAYKNAMVESAGQDVISSALQNKYKEDVKESWLWVKNIWKSDTSTSPVPTYEEYLNLSKTTEELTEAEYNLIMDPIKEVETGWNGYYILIVLAGGVTFASSLLMNGGVARKSTNPNEKSPKRGGLIMKLLLPALMIFFTISSNTVFAAYVVTNSLVSVAITPLFTLLFNAVDKYKEKKAKDAVVVEYRRN